MHYSAEWMEKWIENGGGRERERGKVKNKTQEKINVMVVPNHWLSPARIERKKTEEITLISKLIYFKGNYLYGPFGFRAYFHVSGSIQHRPHPFISLSLCLFRSSRFYYTYILDTIHKIAQRLFIIGGRVARERERERKRERERERMMRHAKSEEREVRTDTTKGSCSRVAKSCKLT